MAHGKNRLAGSTSPYLQQHESNPVDWYPWGEEALQKAKAEDKPIFLSIGYSACHWCHVMERESFENDAIAAIMNQHFVSIKVDREQRPDLDQVYMQAVQMLTGSGGWPMSVFLTPETRPFYGGTYWPPEARWGRPGFPQVLLSVAEAWKTRREEIENQGQEMVMHLQSAEGSGPDGADSLPLSHAELSRAEQSLERSFEPRYGGFGSAPKFPHVMDIELLMRLQTRNPTPQRLQMITRTLDGMALGGIYDHLGGGFSRYSVDDRWLVPHFEKMLYDNALLAGLYVDAYQLTGNDHYREVVVETLDYLLRDMRNPGGGFYSAEDADSEGEEGKFYVWSPKEIQQILGPERGYRFCRMYDVTDRGNFEGHSILNRLHELDTKGHTALVQELSAQAGIPQESLLDQINEDRKRLLEIRAQRVRPGLDDKVLVSWNGLAIHSLAQAGLVLEMPKYVEGALACARFLLKEVRRDDGRLLHVWRDGKSEIDGYLDDYAYLANALVTLAIATGDSSWLAEAHRLAKQMLEFFSDPEGGFYFTAADAEVLISRTKDTIDHSIPSGSGMAATALLRISLLLEDEAMRSEAERTLMASSQLIKRSPGAVGQLLIALDWMLGPVQQVVLRSDSLEIASKIQREWMRKFSPRLLFLTLPCGDEPLDPSLLALSRNKPALDGAAPTMYLCEGNACMAPLVGEGAILEEVSRRG